MWCSCVELGRSSTSRMPKYTASVAICRTTVAVKAWQLLRLLGFHGEFNIQTDQTYLDLWPYGLFYLGSVRTFVRVKLNIWWPLVMLLLFLILVCAQLKHSFTGFSVVTDRKKWYIFPLTAMFISWWLRCQNSVGQVSNVCVFKTRYMVAPCDRCSP